MVFFTSTAMALYEIVKSRSFKKLCNAISGYMTRRFSAHSSNEHFALQKHIERYKVYYNRDLIILNYPLKHILVF